MERQWWKEAVIYQIYPRSFKDSNGDGIGDIRGIIEKTDHLCELGVDAIWLNPVYTSPNDDMGYDISDYYSISSEYGTIEDFDEMIKVLHRNGIRLIMDLVLNHTSDENPWFIESRISKDSPKRDYYIWRDGKNGREPNNWASFFTPSVWKYDARTDQYYLHLFSEKQPDLNWKNEDVRKNVYNMMNWWVDRGVDGFRLDVINLLEKAEDFPDSDKKPNISGYCFDDSMFANLPSTHTYLKEMYQSVFKGKGILSIGETPFITTETALEYVKEGANELNMVFPFELMDVDSGQSGKWEIIDFDFKRFKDIIRRWQTELPGGWNSLFWSNHDQPRAVSRFGDDGKYRVRSAKMLATVLHMLKGTPYIYQGEEIGMTNMPFRGIEDISDLESLNYYKGCVDAGVDKEQAFKPILCKGRDNARTPMQWDDTENAGFSKGRPWQSVNPNYKEINVASCKKDKDSVFYYYQKLIKMRKENPVMVFGEFVPLLEEHESVIAYLRRYEGTSWLVIANFFREKTSAVIPDNIEIGKRLLSNISGGADIGNNKIFLSPYEADVFLIREK
jgi:oligo-1,6-glucosidase